MTATFPQEAHTETPAHVTARIFFVKKPDDYVGRHRRRSWFARMPRSVVATVAAALYIAACVGGVQYFSTAW